MALKTQETTWLKSVLESARVAGLMASGWLAGLLVVLALAFVWAPGPVGADRILGGGCTTKCKNTVATACGDKTGQTCNKTYVGCAPGNNTCTDTGKAGLCKDNDAACVQNNYCNCLDDGG